MRKSNADIRRMLFENDIKHYVLAKKNQCVGSYALQMVA